MYGKLFRQKEQVQDPEATASWSVEREEDNKQRGRRKKPERYCGSCPLGTISSEWDKKSLQISAGGGAISNFNRLDSASCYIV